MSELLQAAATGDLPTTEALLSSGADPNTVDDALGLSPLMLAARGGHTAVLDTLLAAGASDIPGQGGLTALMVAAMADQPAAVACLLDNGADPEQAAASGGRAVHLAASVGALRALRVLEERGAALFAADARGLSIAAYAEHRDQPAVLAYIESARQRQRYRDLHVMLADPSLRARLLGAPRSVAAQEAAEEASATEPHLLPGGPRAAPDVAEMRATTEALGPISEPAFETLLLEHQDHLSSGGEAWPGAWHSYSDEGLVFALYAGPPGLRGRAANLHLRDLTRIDAHSAVLRCANMVGIVAEGVSFQGADLSRACVTDSDLRGADFEGARLHRTDLSRADLRGATLIGADLRFADLEGCDLRGADLRSAKLTGARLSGADLRGVAR